MPLTRATSHATGNGQRIAWAELPPAVQAALRASFLGEYCPKEPAPLLPAGPPHKDCDCMECRPWTA